MKNILGLALSIALFSCSASAAPQTDTGTASITLQAQHHAYIIAFTPKDGNPDKARYFNQVASALDISGSGIDSAQAITVTVKRSLVPTLFQALGYQQERLTAEYNRTIMYLLFDQLQDYPDILQAILAIRERNEAELNSIVNSGFDYLRALK